MATTDAAVYHAGIILDSMARGTLVTDLDWRIRYVNQPLVHALRCSVEDLLGEHLCFAGRKTPVVDSSHDLLDYLVHITKTPPEHMERKTVRVQIPEKKIILV